MLPEMLGALDQVAVGDQDHDRRCIRPPAVRRPSPTVRPVATCRECRIESSFAAIAYTGFPEFMHINGGLFGSL